MPEVWTEKYRPRTLKDFSTHQAIMRTLQWYIDERDMPNVLLYGEPGIGKTAMVHAYARDLYGDYFHDNFKELNASDDRGINIVRTDVKDYAEYAPEGDSISASFLHNIEDIFEGGGVDNKLTFANEDESESPHCCPSMFDASRRSRCEEFFVLTFVDYIYENLFDLIVHRSMGKEISPLFGCSCK